MVGISDGNGHWVVENGFGFLKTYLVLFEVGTGFLLIPFKSEGHFAELPQIQIFLNKQIVSMHLLKQTPLSPRTHAIYHWRANPSKRRR